MSRYTCTITRISPQCEQEIYARISPVLGYDTRTIGIPRKQVGRPIGQEIDLTLNFRHEDDFVRVMELIRAIIYSTSGTADAR